MSAAKGNRKTGAMIRRGLPVAANAGGHCRCGCKKSITKGDLIVIRENKWYLAACMEPRS